MIKYELGYIFIMSIGLFSLMLIIGFILKKTIFKKLIEKEDEEFEDKN